MPDKRRIIRTAAIISKLKRLYPQTGTSLYFSNPLQLLVSTILSAQCTDARVNMVTPPLFAKYKTVKDFANADSSELESYIKSTGFYKMKARHILGAAKAIAENYDGKIPDNIEDLTKLPGVGRKTANCVLGGAFNIQSGIVVDTHVMRLSKRLGLSNQNDPKNIEIELMKLVKQTDWYRFSNLLIIHGRNICKARKPDCLECEISELCPSKKEFVKK